MISSGSDWRDPARYLALAAIDPAGLAWEWLRRDPGYRAAYARWGIGGESARGSPCRRALRWGLVRFEDPVADARSARPIWSRTIDPHILTARVEPASRDDEGFALADWPGMATLVTCPHHGEHLLLHDGCHGVRIDLAGHSLILGRVTLIWQLHGILSAAPLLLGLRRLISLVETGRFADALFSPVIRPARRLLELRVHDAIATGASHQAIARALFGPLVPLGRWRTEASSCRYRVQRLATAARIMATGGWRSLFGMDVSASRSRR